MKHNLKSVRALSATLITLGSLAGGANGAVLITPSSITTTGSTAAGSLAAMTNQSGLSSGYTSGVTDTNIVDITSITHTTSNVSDIWAGGATKANLPTTPSHITIDIGSIVNVTDIAFWQAGFSTQLSAIAFYSDSDSDFLNGTSGSLGSFAPLIGSSGQLFNVTDSNTRFIHLEWSDLHTTTATFVGGIGEVVIGVASPVPEPSSFLLFGLASLGVVARRHRN